MNPTPQQILDLFNHHPTFDNFVNLNNKIVVDALINSSNQFLHITGLQHNGKTHLLKAWVNKAQEEHMSVIYVDIKNGTTNTDIKQLATYYQLIAIDDIDYLNENQQVDLFNLFNSIKLNNRDNKLLTASKFPLDTIDNIREDLKTRILSGLTLSLKTPDDAELLQILKMYCLQEGIKLDDNELNYVITHHTRNIGELISLINQIAQKALVEKKNISIPLIRQLI